MHFHNADGDLDFTSASMVIDGKLGLPETIFAEHFRYLQQQVTTAVPKLTIPSPSMVHYRAGRAAIDPAQRADLAGRGDDAEHQHERYIRQINAALAGRPPGMVVTTHLCRGNFRSSWAAEGGYDFVAEALFGAWRWTGSSWSTTTPDPGASSRCGSCRPVRRWCSGW